MMILGLLVAGLSGFGLAMMHVTQTIPYRWPSSWKRDDDPKAFATFRIVFGSALAAGLAAALIGVLTGW